jgi:hypothetical protein
VRVPGAALGAGVVLGLILGLALLALNLGLGRGSMPAAEPVPVPVPVPGAAELAAAEAAQRVVDAAASELHAALPKDRPGFGTVDYPGNAEGDVPKAYAMVLLAELGRLDHPWRAGDTNLAPTAGHWLLDHADSNRDGVVGWGLPVAWDAYEDGSTNPAHTEYTISTALVLDALLTWAERDGQAPAARIHKVVAGAIAPYLDPRRGSPSGLAPYSLAAADRRYDTFNPAAYLAGQIQRASLGQRDTVLRSRYLAAADATMAALLAHKRIAPASGSWYWDYSVQQEVPNDLPHAGYVIAGIRAYLEHGGRLADRFDWYAVWNHLNDFKGPQGEVRAFPLFAGPDFPFAARAYDVGFALYLACTETRGAELVPWLLGEVPRYRTAAGRYLKYPVGTSGADEVIINEYESYLYRGLSACATRPRALGSGVASLPLHVDERAEAFFQRLAGRAAGSGDLVPLLPGAAGLVSFDQRSRPRIVLDSDRTLSLPRPGVPVKVLRDEGGPASPADSTWVFLREHPDNRLTLWHYRGKALACRIDIPHGDDATAQASLRAARLVALGGVTSLHAVYYHEPSQANWHVRWELGGRCPAPRGAPLALPSLQDPGGSTYEMIPALVLHLVGERLFVAGGNMQVEWTDQGLAVVQRLSGCGHIVETAVTPAGLAHLCMTPLAPDRTGVRRPIVIAPPGVAAPVIDLRRGVPWRLQWSQGALQIDHAASPRQLRHLLRSDLARTGPGGWMEFGIDNTEGRIPWSQIYAINGLLDLLDLAKRDATLLETFGPLLGEVRRRLDMEMAWLDAHIAAGRHHTRAFTVDRSRALFGVQTSRLLLALKRYRTEVPDALPMRSEAALRRAVRRLEGHIEVFATEGEEDRWIRPGLTHLRWPKGSKFYFDGMAVPFNHQNEWAYGVLATAGDDAAAPEAAPAVKAATDVLTHFTDRIARQGRLPLTGEWDYWWGRAHDGWNEPGRYSDNVPRFGGDKIKAYVSFRTIDAMSLLAGASVLGAEVAAHSRASAAALAERGLLYPFVNHALVAHTGQIHLGAEAAQEYARVSSPWELNSAPWALARTALALRAPGAGLAAQAQDRAQHGAQDRAQEKAPASR